MDLTALQYGQSWLRMFPVAGRSKAVHTAFCPRYNYQFHKRARREWEIGPLSASSAVPVASTRYGKPPPLAPPGNGVATAAEMHCTELGKGLVGEFDCVERTGC